MNKKYFICLPKTNIMKLVVISLLSFFIVSKAMAQTFDVEERQILMPCTTGIWQVFDSTGNMLASGLFKSGYTPPSTCYSGVPYRVVFNSLICSPTMVSVFINDPPSIASCSCSPTLNVQVLYIANSKSPVGSCSKTIELTY
jgi:hypothetical protein